MGGIDVPGKKASVAAFSSELLRVAASRGEETKKLFSPVELSGVFLVCEGVAKFILSLSLKLMWKSLLLLIFCSWDGVLFVKS